MSQLLRTLNEQGKMQFGAYLQALKNGATLAPPFHLLTEALFSEALDRDVPIGVITFADSYALGTNLQSALAPLHRRELIYNHGLWSWLALYLFDQLCPADSSGRRAPLEDAVYILAADYDHRRYYRHLVRTPWLAVADNGGCAKVLLQTKAGGKRSDIFEQLVSRQAVFGNPRIIEGAYRLYYDESSQSPKRGASGKGAGSSRRLVTFIQQVDLTYDLRACPVDNFLGLLPKEFDRFAK